MRIYVVFCPLCSLLERVSARGGSMELVAVNHSAERRITAVVSRYLRRRTGLEVDTAISRFAIMILAIRFAASVAHMGEG